MDRTDDPRLGDLLKNDSNIITNSSTPLAKIAIIGYPCDEGVARNNGRIGAKNGPESFRKYFRRLGTVYNPEYDVDLSKLAITDFGDADLAPTLEETHANLTAKVETALRDGYIPIVIGGGNDQSYPNAKAFMNAGGTGVGIGVINIDAHFDVRPLLKDGLAHSGSPFRLLLEDTDFQSGPGVFVEFACQGHQCSKAHADYIKSKSSTSIHWLSQIRDSKFTSAVEYFDNTLSTGFGGGGGQIFVSFDIDSIRGSDCPGVSCPASVGLTAEEALGICRVAGRCDRVGLIDFSEYNPTIEEDRTARLLVNMVYYFCMGVVERYDGREDEGPPVKQKKSKRGSK